MNKFIKDTKQSHSLYFQLIDNYPHLFQSSSVMQYVTSQSEIEKFERDTGETIGLIFQNGKYELFVVDLVDEGGNRSAKGRMLLPNGGVVIIPLMNGKFILEHQYRERTCRYHLAFPRGHREPGCTLVEDATREVLEELSCEKVANFRRLGASYPETGYCAWCCDIVTVDVEGLEFNDDGKIDMNGYEGIDSLALLSLEEIDKKIDEGEIDCGYTLAAWSIYKAMCQTKGSRA